MIYYFKQLLPALIPRWNFFDRIGDPIELQVFESHQWYNWGQQPTSNLQLRNDPRWFWLTSLLVNALRNEQLFHKSLAERYILSQDPKDLALLKERMTRHLESLGSPSSAHFKFRILKNQLEVYVAD